MAASFWDCTAFSVGGVPFARLDVAFAAMARGEWSAFERRLTEGLACAARADEEGGSPSEEALDEAATAFRYDRDLIAAADVNAWLERVQLSADEWTEYLRRDLLRRQWANELEDLLDRFAPSARDLVTTAVVDGICSGAFETFERVLAGRAALVFDAGAAEFTRACGNGEAAAPVDAVVSRLAHTHEHWLSMTVTDDPLPRLATVARIEAAFTAIADGIASNGRLGDIVSDHRLAWLRFELDSMSFATEAAAREAMLCLCADKLSLHDVASLSRSAVTRVVLTLDDVEAERQERLLAAEPGAAVGPLPSGDRFDVAVLVSRNAPDLSDPEIAARARAHALDRAQQRAARDHVKRTTTTQV